MRRCALICFVLLFPQLFQAQKSVPAGAVSEAEALAHLIQKTDPIYPPAAVAARVQGDVVISVSVDAKGQVASEKVISGPAMLQQAAQDAVKTWQFKPFALHGAAAPATTTLTIRFELDQTGPQPTKEQEDAAQAWFPLAGKCQDALKRESEEDSLNYCKQALDMSLKAGDLTTSDQLGRLISHQLYGRALLSAGRAQEALTEESLAVEEAKKCLTDENEEYAEPLFWRAIVEANLGRANAALNDFQSSEETMRRALANLPDMKERYSKFLAAILKQHATLLDLLGRSDDAARLREEAEAL